MSSETHAYRCWAEIDLTALQHNVAAVRSHLGAETAILAVVKADAYGHGVGPVIRALAGRVNMLGVANLQEAHEARTHETRTPILILSPALPEERRGIVDGGFVPLISTLEEARAYAPLATGEPLAIHLKIDTGMGRMGIWEHEAVATAAEILRLPGVAITGLATHLPVADEDDSFTSQQLARFRELANAIRALGCPDAVTHVENSAGLIAHPTKAGDMVRAGLMLYGSAPLAEFQSRLRPPLTWKTRIALLRTAPAGHGISYGRTFITDHPTRVATLAVGYADGYPRHLSGRNAEVLIHGQRCPVLGRVTMDQIIADVSEVADAQIGDETVLLGRQGGAEILAAELAGKAGTIAWEIFTGLGRRVQRFYL